MDFGPVPVLIVGAGPVGLGLACDLALHGIRTVIVEERDGSSAVPKMTYLSARNMEFCRKWGIAESARDAIWPKDHPNDYVYVDTLNGSELARVPLPSVANRAQLGYTPEGPVHCPQIYFDPILARRVLQLGLTRILYNVRFEQLSQDHDGVEATLSHPATGRRDRIRGSYLVGCDGAGSAVREALGIRLEGLGVVSESVNVFFRSVELAGLHDKGWARIYRFIDGSGCWAELIPIDGRELWRLSVLDASRQSPDGRQLVEKAAGASFAFDVLSVLKWQRRDFVAQRFQDGRVFLAGDSAHQCSSAGGFGMHTGLEEVANLGWKLAAAVQGWAGPHLLETYDIERRPVARRNVGLATRVLQGLLAVPGIEAWRGARHGGRANGHQPIAIAPVSSMEHEKLQYGYEASPICVADGSPPQGAASDSFVQVCRAGTRAPHGWLDDGRSSLDLFRDEFVLLRFAPAREAAASLLQAASACRVPMREVPLAEGGVRALYRHELVLVRPDGHVAWCGSAASMPEPGLLVDRVRGARPELRH